MHPPIKIIRALADVWPLIERLVERFAYSHFAFQDAQALLKEQQPDWSGEKLFRETQKLLQLDILIPLAKSSQLEINSAVLEFAQHLLKEHSLGLSSEVEAQVSELARLSSRLEDIASAYDQEELRRFLRRMDDRLRTLIKQFANNESAIRGIVEQAKSSDSTLSLGQRYATVIEAFDEYIEPMLALLDINGNLQKTFEHVELTLSQLIDRVERDGRLNDVKQSILQIRTRLLDMHGKGRQSVHNSAELLLPLREELRRNTLVARATSKVLAKMRKRSVERALVPLLPVIASDQQKFNLGTNHQFLAYLGDICDYQDEVYEFPDAEDVEAAPTHAIPDLDQVSALYAKSQSHQPLHWLMDTYPDLPGDELIFAYQHLINLAQSELHHGDALSIKMDNKTLYATPPFAFG